MDVTLDKTLCLSRSKHWFW